MNMSYCRFENTSKAMSDCLDAIVSGEYDDLTSYERNGLIDILAYCEDILDHKEEIEEELKVKSVSTSLNSREPFSFNADAIS